MSHERSMPKKPTRKPKKDKKRKGIPPHLEREKERSGSLKEIRTHLDDLAQRQK